MDTLTVKTTPVEQNGVFVTTWQWRQGDVSDTPSKGGRVEVRLSDRFHQDRHILAELAALHHLIEREQIHGSGRLGNGLRIQVGFGAIRKALAKGTLKDTGRGNTDKGHVALWSKWLATKYFEADVEVMRPDKWANVEPKKYYETTIDVETLPVVTIPSSLGPVVISRHGLNRVVARYIAKADLKSMKLTEDDLSKLPDKRWTSAWKHLNKVIPASVAWEPSQDEQKRIMKKYGAKVSYLWHQDSGMVIVLVHEPYGLEMVTAYGQEYWVERNVPVQAGQRLLVR